MLNNMAGGLMWGIGTVVGATVVISIMVGLLRTFNFLPFSEQLVNQIQSNFTSEKIQR